MTFAKGAALDDPSGLFNSSLEGTTRRAIDFHEGETIDEQALQALVRAAVALNESKAGGDRQRGQPRGPLARRRRGRMKAHDPGRCRMVHNARKRVLTNVTRARRLSP